MGKWNYRRRWTPKNYYRDQRIPSPPTYFETEFKLRGAWENVDLPWEERFCMSVGIPWVKVVNAKKYMHCYDNVVKWNDSASEETFRDAKERFWEKINGIPTNVPQPDPDIYANDIDWNPDIDPELIKDLELAYFNPDDPENVKNYDASKKNNDGFAPGCILGLDGKNPSNVTNVDNPWERNKNGDLNDKTNGWNCSSNSVNKNTSDPWGRGKNTQDDRDVKDGGGWGGVGSSSWHQEAMWRGGSRNLVDNDITWGGGASNSWQRDQHRDNFQGRHGWERGAGYRRGENVSTSRGTEHNRGQRGGYRGNSFGHQRHNGGGWDSNVGCRKREGSQLYTSSYKSARVQSDDYREGNQYRRT